MAVSSCSTYNTDNLQVWAKSSSVIFFPVSQYFFNLKFGESKSEEELFIHMLLT